MIQLQADTIWQTWAFLCHSSALRKVPQPSLQSLGTLRYPQKSNLFSRLYELGRARSCLGDVEHGCAGGQLRARIRAACSRHFLMFIADFSVGFLIGSPPVFFPLNRHSNLSINWITMNAAMGSFPTKWPKRCCSSNHTTSINPFQMQRSVSTHSLELAV